MSNTLSLHDALPISLDGLGMDGPFGVDARGNSHHITLENLMIIHHSGSQQTVGISTKGPAWNFIIRRNTIIGAGTGIYLGNSDGTDPFVAGVVEYNVILDTIGYNMQIKQQEPRPTGIGLPTGDSRTIIRNNVFSKRSTVVGSDGARPNLLVGHFPLSGAGVNDLYEIYGNFFYDNPTEALFQGESNIALYDNLFVNPAGDAVNIQPQEDKPRNVTVFNNTVVATGGGLRISGGDPGFTQSLIGNASFAGTALSGPNQQGNVSGTYAQAANYLNAPYAAIGSLNLFPKSGQLGGTALSLSSFSAFDDGLKDFNGTARTGIKRGSYEGDGVNPGWTLALSVKPPSGSTGSPAAPTVSVSADPTAVSLQGSSTLHWSTTNAASCTASDGWTGSKAVSGTETVGPLTADKTFMLTCTGTGGSATGSVTVTVTGGTTTPPTSTPSPPTSDPPTSNPPTSTPPTSNPPTSTPPATASPPVATETTPSSGGGALDVWVLASLGLLALQRGRRRWVRIN